MSGRYQTLTEIMATKHPPRRPAERTGSMKERIAVALRGSRPSMMMHEPNEAYTLYLYDLPDMRAMYDKWADDLLRHFDVLGLELIDLAKES